MITIIIINIAFIIKVVKTAKFCFGFALFRHYSSFISKNFEMQNLGEGHKFSFRD